MNDPGNVWNDFGFWLLLLATTCELLRDVSIGSNNSREKSEKSVVYFANEIIDRHLSIK